MDERRGKFGKGACSLCGDRVAASCARCKTPLCESHDHDRDTRCDICEGEYETSFALRDGGLYVAMAVLPPVVLCVVAGLAVNSGPMAMVAMPFISVIGLWTSVKSFPRARASLRRGLRQRFLETEGVPEARLLKD